MNEHLNLAREVIKTHTGPIRSQVPGRTDHLPVHLKSGSYVIPADIISAMGEGNTEAGFKIAKSVFDLGDLPYGVKGLPYSMSTPHRADGGRTEGEAVPVVVAGGEMVIPPEDVIKIGKGSLEDGHKVLDKFVLKMRQKTIKTLQKLPGPAK